MCNLATKICEAHCCAAQLADQYLTKVNKGRDTEQDFFNMLLVDNYLSALDRYKNTISLSGGCSGCGNGQSGSCLTEGEVKSILEQISAICGGCSCNCN